MGPFTLYTQAASPKYVLSALGINSFDVDKSSPSGVGLMKHLCRADCSFVFVCAYCGVESCVGCGEAAVVVFSRTALEGIPGTALEKSKVRPMTLLMAHEDCMDKAPDEVRARLGRK